MYDKIYAIVPAAGSGQRFGGDIPKQYLPLCGKTVLEQSLNQLASFVEKIVVAIASDDTVFNGLACAHDPKIICAPGGQSRSESVNRALAKLSAEQDDWVLIHDAVRPLISQKDIQHLIDTLKDHPYGGLLAVPVNDTVKRANQEREVSYTENRDSLWLAQTPQMFRYGALQSALNESVDDTLVTDESMAMEKAGYAVKLVPGSHSNFKITRPEDMKMAELIIRDRREDFS